MIKKRLTKKEFEYLKHLIASGFSLNKIIKLTDKSKTTIYYHFRKIKGKTYSSIKIDEKDQLHIGEFMGIFAADGNFFKTKQYHYRVFLFFGPEEEERKNQVKGFLTRLFAKSPIESNRSNLLILYYCSKPLYEFIKEYLVWNKGGKKTYSISLREKNFSNDFKIGFLRGNIDSDGYISKRKISFASVSEKLMDNIMVFLNNLDISYTKGIHNDKRPNRKTIYYVDISKKNHEKFLNVIKPRKKVRV